MSLFVAGQQLPAQVDVSVELLGSPSTDGPGPIVLVAEPADQKPASRSKPIEFLVEPGVSTVDLSADRTWKLQARLPGYWSPEVEILPATVESGVTLQLFPTGTLSGTLSVAEDQTPPSRMEIGFEGDVLRPKATESLAGSVACQVANGMFHCDVPAGTWDLILRGGQFVPKHLREVRLRPGKVYDLGVFELELGGTVWGWLELEGGDSPSEECRVRLIHRGGSLATSGSNAVLSASVDSDGVFEFIGAPAGGIILTGSQPDYLPTTTSTIQVVPGQRLDLPQPLVLRRPATLELNFTPVTGPGGRGWRFTVSRIDPQSEKATQSVGGESDEDGRWVKDGMVPGLYLVMMTEQVGPKRWSKRIEIRGGRSSVPIDLPIVIVEGQVLLSDEPLAAQVRFSGSGDDKRSLSFKSDEDGVFQGLLPHGGTWKIRVDAPAEGVSRSLDPIEVWPQGNDGVAVVEILVPGTVLEGQVTDLFGASVEEATVQVQRRGVSRGSQRVRTDAEGRFRIRGLAPGSISVMAQSGRLRSQWFHLVVYDGERIKALQLVVR